LGQDQLLGGQVGVGDGCRGGQRQLGQDAVGGIAAIVVVEVDAALPEDLEEFAFAQREVQVVIQGGSGVGAVVDRAAQVLLGVAGYQIGFRHDGRQD